MALWSVFRCWPVLPGFTFGLAISAFAQPVSTGLSDTLTVDHRCVVFYAPSLSQRDAYPQSRIGILDSLSRKFNRTQRGITPFIRKVGISPVTTIRMTMQFGHGDSSTVIQRTSKDLFGIVLYSPGKAPERIRGVPSDVEVLKHIFPYFGIR